MALNKFTDKTWIFKGMVFIIPLRLLRKTPDVEFYNVHGVLDHLGAVDKVIHKKGARSPMVKGWKGEPPWYFHPDQEDRLVVHEGNRIVELYTREHGKVERFEVGPNWIKHKGKILYKGEAILGWPTHVFHRVHSPEGSISTNYAKRLEHFDIRTNFNIYDLDVKTGEMKLIREGYKDQPSIK